MRGLVHLSSLTCPMSLDLRVLYPHFHAESTRHATATASTSPRPTSSKGVRKPDEDSRNVARRSAKKALSPVKMPSTNSSGQRRAVTAAVAPLTRSTSMQRLGATVPPIASLPVGTRPSTSTSMIGACRNDPAVETRAVALRGELAIEPNEPPRLVRSNSLQSQRRVQPQGASSTSLHEVVQCSARPRSRYARREGLATAIEPLRQVQADQCDQQPRLVCSASTPTLGAISTRLLRGSHTVVGNQKPHHSPPLISSWTEKDAASFFLTEIDDGTQQRQIAEGVAQGSHLLYAAGDFERAVARFADALSVVQQQQPQQGQCVALSSLLHHHMGVAFKEDGRHRWATMMQKKALELAEQCDDEKLQGRALKALGVLFLDSNDAQRALDCQQQALQLALDAGDRELEARVYANLGNLASAQNQLAHAVTCHLKDLDACASTNLDSTVGQARAHKNLSLVYASLNEREKQLEHELEGTRLMASKAFETDMRRHANDVVGNIYLQLSSPDRVLAELVTHALRDILTDKEANGARADNPSRDLRVKQKG